MATVEQAALQAAHEAINAKVGELAEPAHQLIAAKCRALMTGYHTRWENAGYTPILVEQVIQKNLYNPETQRQSRSFTIAGKLDVLAEYAGRKVLIDHKTTSEEIDNPDAPYWRQLVVEGQVNHYMLLAWMDSLKVDNAVWDVIRKPDIRPKKLSKAERASVVAEGRYFGARVSDHGRQSLAAGEERESLDMYEARLAHDCTVERPERYFQRRAVPRLDSEIAEYAEKLWDIGQDMLHVRHTGRHYTNPTACIRYGSPCTYLGICSGHDAADSDRWATRNNVHPELDGLDGDGRDVITNSRISCFQTCKRLHHFKYDLGIERVAEEEKEALLFGTCWHLAQEAWWKEIGNVG